MTLSLEMLPSLNASLNGTSALFLITGYLFIRRKRVEIHRLFMILAFLTSTLFLASYLYYHAHHRATRFPGSGFWHGIYLAILISHTILATLIVPLVLRTLYLAIRKRFESHRRLARWTFPLWLYVSVTGVVVYWMLYEVAWGCPACSEAIASGGNSMASQHFLRGWARSIQFMMLMPYLVFGCTTFVIVRSIRRNRRDNSFADPNRQQN